MENTHGRPECNRFWCLAFKEDCLNKQSSATCSTRSVNNKSFAKTTRVGTRSNTQMNALCKQCNLQHSWNNLPLNLAIDHDCQLQHENGSAGGKPTLWCFWKKIDQIGRWSMTLLSFNFVLPCGQSRNPNPNPKAAKAFVCGIQMFIIRIKVSGPMFSTIFVIRLRVRLMLACDFTLAHAHRYEMSWRVTLLWIVHGTRNRDVL